MLPVSSSKAALIFLSVLAFSSQPHLLRAGEVKAPVFRRTGSGHLIMTGERRAVPDQLIRQRRAFSYEMPLQPGFDRLLKGSSAEPAAVEGSLNVVMIRVAFENNSMSSLSSIYTDGDFDLSPYDSSIVDPLPHNRTYFNAHMQGLANFLHFQSCGRLELTWEILPLEEDGSYKLSDIAEYGPGSYTTGWTTPRLTRFLNDAVVKADEELSLAGYPRRLSDYDAIILVHAGADIQSDYDGDSPNDIPSFFAILGDGDEITIEGGSTIIREISVVPETATQDGGYGSMASVLAHEFGHVMGLPDLYDVYYGFPIVGVWDQMDSGPLLGAYIPDLRGEIIYVTGMLPSGFGAWSRYMLGWAETDTVKVFENNISLPAVEECPSRLVRLDVSSEEYFLIENRAVELDDIRTIYASDPVTGVVIGTGNCPNCGDGNPDDDDWELVNGYDILLPTESDMIETDAGPGILVWHIDESFIEDRWYINEVNSRWPFGVSLVEGSGVRDLGNPYSSFRMGWYDDAFYEGNRSEFSDSTIPSSWSSWQVPTGARIEGISARDTMMTFGAGIRDLRNVESILAPSDLAEGGILQIPGGTSSLMIDIHGNGIVAGDDGQAFSLGCPALTPAAFSEEFDPDSGDDAVLVGDSDGSVHAFRVSSGSWDEYGGWPFDTGALLVSHPVPVKRLNESFVSVTDNEGRLWLLDFEGSAVTSTALPAGSSFTGNISVEIDQQGYSTGIYTLASIDGEDRISIIHWVFGAGSQLVPDDQWQYHIPFSPDEIAGGIALLGGDIDPERNGSEVYLSSLETGRILFCDRNGVISERETGAALTGVPALQDINGDGYIDICCSDGSRIYVISSSGSNVSGWPRSVNGVFDLPAEVKVSSPLTTMGNSSGSWIAAGTDEGIFFVFDYRGELVPGYPKKMASSFDGPVDIVVSGEEALFSYSDLVLNIGYNSYFEFRPEGGKMRWRLAPFDGSGIDHSWTGLWGGPERISFALSSEGFSQTIADWSEIEDNLIVYPNPSTGERVGFHFTAPVSGEAHIQILTLSGEMVMEERKSLLGGEDEFALSLSGKASGIYICRLVIVSEGRKYQAQRKFAIVN
ncbi:MAG: T9SS type A sorting domain-containing protein [Candidatus Krumholzibacteriota bacterium]|nr:T9SS type A sorting domain-containing protein [Candidatus Krumholzibacteriota bacterium]